MIRSLTATVLPRLHADRVFIGDTGAVVPEGAPMPHVVVSETRAAMLGVDAHCTVLADHADRLAGFAQWWHVEALTGDLPLPAEPGRDVRAKGVPTLFSHDFAQFARPFSRMSLGRVPRRRPTESART